MLLMAGDDERQRARRDRTTAGCADSSPGLIAEAAHHRQVAPPGARELVEESPQIAAFGIRSRGVLVLVEAGERLPLAPRDGQGPVAKNPFQIDEMVHHPTDGPFARLVPVEALLLGERPEGRADLPDLAFEEAEDVVVFDQRDISIVVGLVFAGLGLLHEVAPYFKCLLNHSTIRWSRSRQ